METSLARLIARRAIFAALTCVFSLVGAGVGMIVGAMQGQTTETGFVHGSGIGAVTGAITAVQLLESLAEGDPLSKVALLYSSLMNGKLFMEWQWQVSSMETSYYGEIYDTSGVRGLSQEDIQSLPHFTLQPSSNILHQSSSCSICLHELKGGDEMRKLPYCGHLFHLDCVDKWLPQNGSCPVCRNNIICCS